MTISQNRSFLPYMNYKQLQEFRQSEYGNASLLNQTAEIEADFLMRIVLIVVYTQPLLSIQ